MNYSSLVVPQPTRLSALEQIPEDYESPLWCIIGSKTLPIHAVTQDAPCAGEEHIHGCRCHPHIGMGCDSLAGQVEKCSEKPRRTSFGGHVVQAVSDGIAELLLLNTELRTFETSCPLAHKAEILLTLECPASRLLPQGIDQSISGQGGKMGINTPGVIRFKADCGLLEPPEKCHGFLGSDITNLFGVDKAIGVTMDPDVMRENRINEQPELTQSAIAFPVGAGRFPCLT
jgi:hypothetical protein